MNVFPATQLLSVGEAALALGISAPTAYRLINAGNLPAHRVGGQYRIDSRELGAWLERNRVEVPA